MLDLDDDWVWDFWTVRDDDVSPPRHHLFFLHAPRSLRDPDLRHVNARVGHAVSTDLRSWTRLPDALGPQPAPAFDDLATWTGSCVRGPDGRWWLFTSGLSRGGGLVQRFGSATSTDLVSWRRTDLVSEIDPRWYANEDHRGEGHWRDPFVIGGADGWHLYLTAKAAPETWPGAHGNGVVGHLTSPDLVDWTVRPPLGGPTGRFDQLEVVSLSEVEGRWALLFSCLSPEVVDAAPGAGGVWSVPVDGPGAPVDLDRAVRMTSEDLYVGRVVDTDQGPRFLAFENRGEDGRFTGGVIDPVPIRWRADGAGLELTADAVIPARWRP